MKVPKMTLAMEMAWQKWDAEKLHKVPSTQRKGPRMVFTAEQKAVRRMEYMVGYYAKKSQSYKRMLDELKKKMREQS